MQDSGSRSSSNAPVSERGFRIIAREEWGARPPEAVTPWDPSDLYGLTVHWFGIPAAAPRHELCDDLVRSVQRSHQAGEFNDIAYNHLWCEHGYVYEGRGFKFQTGANGTKYANRHYGAICYMAGRPKAQGVSDEDLLRAVEELATIGVCSCEASSVERARGRVTGAVDPFPERAQDAGGWLISEWFKRGTDQVVVPHQKWTGSECPGPLVGEWVVKGGWREDLPTPEQVKFELCDDGGKIEESIVVSIDDEAERFSIFLRRVEATALQHLREEDNLGSVELRRRVVTGN